MTYTVSRDGDALVVSVEGRIDINTSPVLEEGLADAFEGVTDFTLDLAGVDYVSSMGLRLILALQKRMFKQGAMRVTHVQGPVMEIFEETGFSEILTIA